MPVQAGKRKKTRTHTKEIEKDETEDVPSSIVARASKVSSNVKDFINDFRKLMGPHTALNLRERNYNRMKDYAAVANQLKVSHLFAISQTKSNIVMRLAKFHNGPTLHFRLSEYCLGKHVRATQKRPFESSAAYQTPPLVVLNNFGPCDSNHMKLLKITLHSIFPTINVNTVRLTECRRVVLFHYKTDTDCVEMRHYAIRAVPVGVNRSIKKILQSKIPNLSHVNDISDFLEGEAAQGMYSDSEAEDETAKVELPDKFTGRGNGKSQKSAIKLIEIGPRVTLELFKVEQGMCEGEVLYHKFESKTAAESAATKARLEKERMLKIQRRSVQEQNVKRKREEQEMLKQNKQEAKKAKMEARLAKEKATGEPQEEDSDEDESESNENEEYESDGGDVSDNSDEDEEDDDDEI